MILEKKVPLKSERQIIIKKVQTQIFQTIKSTYISSLILILSSMYSKNIEEMAWSIYERKEDRLVFKLKCNDFKEN